MVKRQVIPNWRGALELLAGSADGCTEALLFAHGFTEATIAGLIDTGLVVATTKRVSAGRGNVDLTWFKITGRGRAAGLYLLHGGASGTDVGGYHEQEEAADCLYRCRARYRRGGFLGSGRGQRRRQ